MSRYDLGKLICYVVFTLVVVLAAYVVWTTDSPQGCNPRDDSCAVGCP